MLNTFRTLSGAVSTKDFIPSLTHFALQSGRAAAFDGRVYISAPAPELSHLPPLTAPADALLAALEGCGEDPPSLSFDAESGRLRVTSKRFTARIPVGEAAAFPFSAASEKGAKKLNGSILSALKALRPFVGDDASRPWCSSILLRGAVAFASNNVVLAEQSLPMIFPLPSALPVFAVDELLRIGAEPRAVAADERALTFFLPDGVFLRAALFSEAWPDPKPPLQAAFAQYTPTPIPPQLLDRKSVV